jgi:SSS family solute:Na+ symporter
MDLGIFIPLLFGLQMIYWFIGRRSSKNVEGQEDYFLAKKSVRFFPLMMTFLATQVGGGLVLGAADEAYRYGWSVLLYPLGASLGMICLGLGIGQKLARFKVSTVAEILEVVYRSPGLRKIASILSVISLFMVLVAQIIASHKFLAAIGFSNPYLFALFWGVIILYTVQGGLRAVISTDIAQAAVFSLVFLCGFGVILFKGLAPPFALSLESFSLGSSKLTGWLLMPLLYIFIEQDMGQRCFAGNSPRTVSRAAFWSGIGIMIVCVIPVALGVLAKTAGLAIPAGASVLMISIAYATNPWVAALVGCAVLAAIISTASSLLNAISSNLSQDFELLRAKKSLRSIQALTLGLSIASLVVAFYFDNVVDVLIQSYELFVSCLFVPIFIALFKKRGHFLSGLLSILFGIAAFCLFKVFPPPLPSEIASILLSLLGYGCGEVLSRLRYREVEDAA